MLAGVFMAAEPDVYAVCVRLPKDARRGLEKVGAFSPQHWEPNSLSLEEQQGLLTVQPTDSFKKDF